MKAIRAKFEVNNVTKYKGGFEQIKAYPVLGAGGEENKSFADATPAGFIELTISNPDAKGFLAEGDSFYLDITKAE